MKLATKHTLNLIIALVQGFFLGLLKNWWWWVMAFCCWEASKVATTQFQKLCLFMGVCGVFALSNEIDNLKKELLEKKE